MNAMCFGAMLVIDFTLHVEVMKNERDLLLLRQLAKLEMV